MANQRAPLAAISALDNLNVKLPAGRVGALTAEAALAPPTAKSAPAAVASPLDKYTSEKSSDDDLMVPLSLRIPLGVKKKLEALRRRSINPSEFARDWIEFGLRELDAKKR